MGTTPMLTAALAGVPLGIQRQGSWSGRRQLFIRFAGPAETATMYTADALARELKRGLERSVVHSICIAGRDALANSEYLLAALKAVGGQVPVMVDTDGQRPEAIAVLHPYLQMVQVTVEPPVQAATLDRAMETIRAAARVGCVHGVVVAGADDTSDADYLQIVEQAHTASPQAAVIIHRIRRAPGVCRKVRHSDGDQLLLSLLSRRAGGGGQGPARRPGRCPGLRRPLPPGLAFFRDGLFLATGPQVAGSANVVADLGSHWCDLVQFITGEKIVEVMAELHTCLPKRRKPRAGPLSFGAVQAGESEEVAITLGDYASLFLKLSNGARGSFTTCQAAAGRKVDIELQVFGSKESYAWSHVHPNVLWIGHREKANEVFYESSQLQAADTTIR